MGSVCGVDGIRVWGCLDPCSDPCLFCRGQGSSCWSFSAAGAIEGAAAIASKSAAVSVSNQQIMDCSGIDCLDAVNGTSERRRSSHLITTEPHSISSNHTQSHPTTPNHIQYYPISSHLIPSHRIPSHPTPPTLPPRSD
mgnify:CR=1 FL=1